MALTRSTPVTSGTSTTSRSEGCVEPSPDLSGPISAHATPTRTVAASTTQNLPIPPTLFMAFRRCRPSKGFPGVRLRIDAPAGTETADVENVHYVKKKGLVVVVAAIMLLSVAVARAADHRAPRATLRVGDEIRNGRLYHSDGWARKAKDPRFCVATFGTGFPTFGKPIVYPLGEELVIRLHKSAPPVEVEVQTWPRVDEDGMARGTPSPVPWVLRPYVDGNVRAWELVISPPVTAGHVYLGVGAYWPDEDGCSPPPDLGSQYAAWTFHLVNR